MIDIDSAAPALTRQSATVPLPPSRVHELLTQVEAWPSWQSAVSKARLDGPVAVGTRFRWTSGGTPIRSQFLELDPGRRVVWSGTSMGLKAIHVWELEPDGSGTRVHTRESMSGLPARLAPKAVQRTLDKAVADALSALAAQGTP